MLVEWCALDGGFVVGLRGSGLEEAMDLKRLVVLMLLVSCGDPVELSIDEHADDTLRELRDRQLIRYEDEQGEVVEEDFLDPAATIHGWLAAECSALEYEDANGDLTGWTLQTDYCPGDTAYVCSDYPSPRSSSCSCAEMACEMRQFSCMQNLRLEMARSSTPITLRAELGNGIETVTVFPQSQATRAAIAEASLVAAATEASTRRGFFNSMTLGADCTDDYPVSGGGSATLDNAGAIPALWGEAYELALEASEIAQETYIALADAEFSRRSGLEDGALAARELRVHAAQLLTGGGGYTTSPVAATGCTLPSLSPGGAEAVAILRYVGLDPADLDTLTTTQMLFRTSGPSVKNRMAHLWGQEELILGPPGLTDDEFLASLGLTESDFEEARQHINEETRVFDRNSTTSVGDVPNEMTHDTVIYAGTAVVPTAPPSLFYSQLVGRIDDPGATSRQQFRVNQGALAMTLYHAYYGANALAGSPNTDIADGGDRMAARASREVKGEVNVGPGMSDVYVEVVEFGTADYSSSVLVLSSDALECAVDGVVDGVECDWATHVDPVLVELTGSEFVFPVGMSPFWYMLDVRPGATPLSVGSYVPVVAGTTENDTIPITPALYAESGELMTPSEDWCVRPDRMCGEFKFGGRLPLEDELNDDGDAFESSWRRYLALARQAADEADFLGEEALEAAFDITVRAEDASSELEDLCGVPVNINPLAEELGTNPGDDPIEALSTLITDDQSLEALANCVSDDNVYRYAALGSHDLCVWYPKPGGGAAQTGRICEFDGMGEPDLACPRVPTEIDRTMGCRPPNGDSTNYQAFKISDADPDTLLGIFSLEGEELPTDEAPTADFCALIRDARAASFTSVDDVRSAWSEVLGHERSSFVSTASFQAIAPRVRWEAHVDSHSTLLLDDNALLTTGNINGASTSGICDTSVLPEGCVVGQEASLFCAQVDCTDPAARALLNARFAAAATVARWFGGSDLTAFVVPRHDDDRPSGWTEWQRYGSTTPAVGSFSEGASPSGSFYCYTGTPGATAWRFARPNPFDPSAGATDDFLSYTTHCGDNDSVRFYSINGDRSYGARNSPGRRTIDSARLRADLLVGRLRNAAPSSGLNPIDATHGPYAGVETACGAQCARDFVDNREFPWVEVMESRNAPENQINRSGLRFFLDLKNETRLPRQAFFDGLELLCEASRRSAEETDVDIGTVTSRNALDAAADKLERAAGTVRRNAAAIVLRDLPHSVADIVSGQALDGTSDLGGQYGASVLRTRAAIEELAITPDQIALQVDGIARDIRRVDLALRRADNNEELIELDLRRDVATQMTRCAESLFAGQGKSVLAVKATTAGLLRAAITCANAIAQAVWAAKQRVARLDNVEVDRQLAFLEFEERGAERIAAIQMAESRTRAAANELQAALLELETIRKNARRALSRALFLEDDGTGEIFRGNRFTRRRLATANERYRRAREDAVAMSWLAKLAIEQRFAIRLADINDDMTLVDAPASWETLLCELEGLNFDRIVEEEAEEGEAYQYADEYIGEYVTRLENFVESYRFDYPFQNAADTAVISLRDDVVNARAMCPADVANRLNHANNFSSLATAETPGWTLADCYEDVEGNFLPSCVNVDLATPADGVGAGMGSQPDAPLLIGDGELGVPNIYTVTFGGYQHPDCAAMPVGPDCECEGRASCGFEPGASFGQDVLVGGGLHRVSWYGRNIVGSPVAAADLVQVRGLDSSEDFTATAESDLPTCTMNSECLSNSCDTMAGRCNPADGEWVRYWYTFAIPLAETIRVAMQWDTAVTTPGITSVDVAGLMLEDLSSVAREVSASDEPGVWSSTADTLEHPQPVCEDTEGRNFRRDGWRPRKCVSLCRDGFGRDCTPDRADRYCYWETEFTISQSDIDRGTILNEAGFARGNFNYRVDGIAVNFVGSGARECEGAPLPSTCYSAGYVPYSLHHLGPYVARNHVGADYVAPLFNGYIEHARGLAAERYLTNPISSADRALIEPYMQRQFRGRPLTGTYVLRIWDDGSVIFDEIEDVQVLLDYRFWTRFD